MKQWEYLTQWFNPTDEDVNAALDKQGKQGWELVAATGDNGNLLAIYKREIKNKTVRTSIDHVEVEYMDADDDEDPKYEPFRDPPIAIGPDGLIYQ